jgi:hypothetical protein
MNYFQKSIVPLGSAPASPAYPSNKSSITNEYGALEISRRSLTAEARFRYRDSSGGICDAQSGIGTVLQFYLVGIKCATN